MNAFVSPLAAIASIASNGDQKEDKTLLQHSQLSQHGEFRHVSVSERQRSRPCRQNLRVPFLRTVLPPEVEESARVSVVATWQLDQTVTLSLCYSSTAATRSVVAPRTSNKKHIFFHYTEKYLCRGVVYFTVLCDHPCLVSLLFAVLVSLHPVTFSNVLYSYGFVLLV